MFASVLSLGLFAAGTAPGDASGITWVHDNWSAAKQSAAKSEQLVAVDVWATWCHTCLSMKNFVLKEAPLAKAREGFQWLALDFDKETNAKFFEQFPVNAFPTFMVIDPKTERVVARWAGSGTAQEMASFFIEAKDSAAGPLARAQQALSRQDYAAARTILQEELAKPAEDHHYRTRVLNAWIEALWKTDQEACAWEGHQHLDEVTNIAPGVDYAAIVAYCAMELAEPRKRKVLEAVVARLVPIAGREDLPLAVDDRSGLYGVLIDVYDALDNSEKATAAVTQRLALLEKAAKAAPTPAARATFDYHRMEGYVRLGKLDVAEKMLLASEKAQPRDFNHPWRLAQVYLQKKDMKKGLAAIDRALANGYGGRRLRLYTTKIDLLLAGGRADEAKRTYSAARSEVDKMAKSQVRKGWLDELESRDARIQAALTHRKG